MEEQTVRVYDVETNEPKWLTIDKYLATCLGALVPMSVGQCLRFRMGGVDAVSPVPSAEEITSTTQRGQPCVYAAPAEGVILLLPKPVRVDVSFEGNHVIKAAGLAPAAPKPTMESEILGLLGKGELKLEPYQKRIAKMFDDKTAMVSMSSRRAAARVQILHHAKLIADPNCAVCSGAGILQQQRIGDEPVEKWCICCITKSK